MSNHALLLFNTTFRVMSTTNYHNQRHCYLLLSAIIASSNYAHPHHYHHLTQSLIVTHNHHTACHNMLTFFDFFCIFTFHILNLIVKIWISSLIKIFFSFLFLPVIHIYIRHWTLFYFFVYLLFIFKCYSENLNSATN